jgi:hypothetical protein
VHQNYKDKVVNTKYESDTQLLTGVGAIYRSDGARVPMPIATKSITYSQSIAVTIPAVRTLKPLDHCKRTKVCTAIAYRAKWHIKIHNFRNIYRCIRTRILRATLVSPSSWIAPDHAR